ncbi:M23 family metallopeptidase [Prosthecobacter sp.]|uniref:M23 family metallopeptidase n=1 Tax=Prosthecobacter sp. TaxID=1965333 RepID=UPI002ABA128E|nr:M23 family metallopeptidase [Prosthecobacter sp.]MDZ4404354.1 M23 family metallopeptidase [Prosthecobacter sp.]
MICACSALMLLATNAPAQSGSTMRVRLADGFDFPVGKPDADGYYKARGYWPNGHLGEDWNGRGGGDSDLGVPIYAIGRGVVIFSQNIGVGWGNCILVRHIFREADGRIAMVDSLYAHLNERKVKLHEFVEKGQLVGTMGGNNGMYPVHLHLEVRKNLHIGMNRSQFARDSSNYYSPTSFINAHRVLSSSTQKYDVPVNNFAPYGRALADVRSDGSSTASVDVPSFQSGGSGTVKDEPKQGDDFWSRLKAKMRNGQATPGTEEKR